MTIVPIAIFWMLAAWGLVSRRPVLLYLFFGSMPFGSFAAVPTALTGGLTFTATPLVMVLIILRVFLSREGPTFFLNSALKMDRLGLLFLFWLAAIVTTLFMPRIFAEDVLVVPIRDVRAGAVALQPTVQNISQLLYLSISILTVFAFANILRSSVDRQFALKALCFGGAVTVATGLIDYSTQFLPIEPLLEPLRTATYALATNIEVMGSKRVVGLMPEASAFGGLCLGLLSLLVFFRRIISDRRVRNVYAPIVIAGLAVFTYLSTSSGAYLGLGVLVLVLGAEALLRAFSTSSNGKLARQDLVSELAVVLGIVVVVGTLFVLRPAVMEPVFALVDRMVLQKAESASFEERGLWRTVALDSLWSTYGLGVGLGGTRASSSMVAIFSNTGLLGGILFYAFVLQTLLRRSTYMNWEGQRTLSAFRFSFIPPFVLSLLVGGTDFGALLAFGFGIVSAQVFSQKEIAARKRTERRRREFAEAEWREAAPQYPLLPQGGS